MAKKQENPLNAKQEAFARALYTIGSDTYDNGTESARAAGYKGNENTLAMTASRMIRKDKIIALKAEIQAVTVVKLEHNRTIAINLLNEAIDMARTQGNTSAIIAATRELNAISNLHGQTITTKSEEVAISEQDQPVIEEATRELTMRLARNTG